MDYDDFLSYAKSIPILRASEMLDLIKVSSFPTAEKGYKDKLHRELRKAAAPEFFDKPKTVVTLEDVSRMLNRG